jgi:hypothetical protein
MAGAEFPLEHKRCDRARQWSSLRLDGELSELESVLLDKHLEMCGACLAFDQRLHAAATMLRLTPPEAPLAPIQLPELPERRVGFPVRRRLMVAAIAAALALGSVVGSSLHRPAPDRSIPAPQVSLLTRDMSQLREIPRGKLVLPAPAHDPGGPPEGLI